MALQLHSWPWLGDVGEGKLCGEIRPSDRLSNGVSQITEERGWASEKYLSLSL